MKYLIFVLTLVLSAARVGAQTPTDPHPDSKSCDTISTNMSGQAIFASTIYLGFCSAVVVESYSLWVDGEVITLNGPATDLMKSSLASTVTGMYDYILPKLTKVLEVRKHWIAILLKDNLGKESMPSAPVPLLITAAAPPNDCTGQVQLFVGEVRPRTTVPQGRVEVTFSLTQSKVPVTTVEVRVNDVAVPSGLPLADDLRGVGSMRFAAPAIEGDYTVSVIAFGSNGCSDGVDRFLPLTVKK